MRKEYKIAIVLAIIGVVMVVSLVIYEMIDFYNDYKCSTSQDINWFMENNCMRYVERDLNGNR